MKDSKNFNVQTGLTSNSFLVNVMPHIKISQKNFPLNGIDPAVEKEYAPISTWQTLSK